MSEEIKERADVFDEIGLSGWHFSKLVKDMINKATGLDLLEDKLSPESITSFNRQLSGVVFLTGEKDIMMSLSMSYATASSLVAYMTNMPLAEIRLEEQSDMVVELANMIAGQTKAMLASVGSRYKYMQPFTVVGDNHYLLQKQNANSLHLKFRSGAIEILIMITVQ